MEKYWGHSNEYKKDTCKQVIKEWLQQKQPEKMQKQIDLEIERFNMQKIHLKGERQTLDFQLRFDAGRVSMLRDLLGDLEK